MRIAVDSAARRQQCAEHYQLDDPVPAMRRAPSTRRSRAGNAQSTINLRIPRRQCAEHYQLDGSGRQCTRQPKASRRKTREALYYLLLRRLNIARHVGLYTELLC
jgi:hypothetical protein